MSDLSQDWYSCVTVMCVRVCQAYPGGLDDSVLTILAAVSRQATVDEIRTWSITRIDTLTALMDQTYGEWDKEKVCVRSNKTN